MDEPRVIYEDKNFLAIAKPAGLLVHETGKKGSNEPTLVAWLCARYPEIRGVGEPVKLPDGSHGPRDPLRPGIVHRLDRETSGVMLVARNREYFEYLKGLFAHRKVRKTYLALVFGTPKAKYGVAETAIGLKPGTTKRSVYASRMRKEAKTTFIVRRECTAPDGAKVSLLEVMPETGRTHQIRVHLSSIGHPIIGDLVYGPKRQPSWVLRLMLHELSVEFSLSEGKRIKIEAEPPAEFANFIQEGTQ